MSSYSIRMPNSLQCILHARIPRKPENKTWFLENFPFSAYIIAAADNRFAWFVYLRMSLYNLLRLHSDYSLPLAVALQLTLSRMIYGQLLRFDTFLINRLSFLKLSAGYYKYSTCQRDAKSNIARRSNFIYELSNNRPATLYFREPYRIRSSAQVITVLKLSLFETAKIIRENKEVKGGINSYKGRFF